MYITMYSIYIENYVINQHETLSAVCVTITIDLIAYYLWGWVKLNILNNVEWVDFIKDVMFNIKIYCYLA